MRVHAHAWSSINVANFWYGRLASIDVQTINVDVANVVKILDGGHFAEDRLLCLTSNIARQITLLLLLLFTLKQRKKWTRKLFTSMRAEY